jgi:dUTP pyrophosphatase
MENRQITVTVKVQRLASARDLPLPARATALCAGMDLRAAVDHDVRIDPGTTVSVPTGLRIAVPPGFEAQVRPRSGLALKNRILVPNSPGTIDADYRGEVAVILFNGGSDAFVIRRGDRIAQMVVKPVPLVELEEVDTLEETDRGAGGFGSTGLE